jgi:hypothetical protein
MAPAMAATLFEGRAHGRLTNLKARAGADRGLRRADAETDGTTPPSLDVAQGRRETASYDGRN